ncbi:MAG: MarR family winged helix-turn-helix transcriptional regulator [Anaerovoracaceae bacterium]
MEFKPTYALQFIKIISDKIQKDINRNLQDYDLTFAQVQVVEMMFFSGREFFSMKELESMLKVSQQNVSGIVRRLESKELLYSKPCSKDKRVKLVALTKKGLTLAKQVRGKIEEINDGFLEPLDDTEKKELRLLLSKVYQHYEDM